MCGYGGNSVDGNSVDGNSGKWSWRYQGNTSFVLVIEIYMLVLLL